MKKNLNRGLAVIALSLSVAWAAAATQTVEVLDASGTVVASGALHGHLKVSGNLGAGRSLRVTTTAGGTTTTRTFTLAATPARGTEAEALKVQVGSRAVPLEAALGGAGEDRGQAAQARHGADDGAGHDAGDDHGGGRDDGAGHDAGDDHGGSDGGGGSDDGGGHGGGHGGHGGGHH